jgi:hypothetical protein
VVRHRLARCLRRLGGNRLDHLAMFGDRRGPAVRALEVAAQLLEQWVVAFVEQLRHQPQQHRVLRRLRDADVKQAVAARGCQAGGSFFLHQRDGLAQRRDLGPLHAARGLRGEFAFDQLPGA